MRIRGSLQKTRVIVLSLGTFRKRAVDLTMMMRGVSFKMIPPLTSKKCLSYQSPWFVVKDACKCLELKDDAGTICRELDEQDKVTL